MPVRRKLKVERCTCGAREGDLHIGGCDMERCPFCGYSIYHCFCPYEQLGLYDPARYGADTHHLPPDVFYSGLSEAQWQQWCALIDQKGAIPFIFYPQMCGLCGELWPDFFRVPDEEWAAYIPPDKHDLIICRLCYDRIRQTVDAGGQVEYPSACCRCGQVNPAQMAEYSEEWELYVAPLERKKTLCRDCFATVKSLIQQGQARRKKSQKE